jgi:hypothetical protein
MARSVSFPQSPATRGDLGIGKGAIGDKLHAALGSM